MSKFGTLLGGRRRADGYAGVLMQFAQEVVERRRSIQGAINEVRHPSVLDALSDEDFRALGEAIEEAAPVNMEFAMALARLTHAAARAKGFDRQIVDAALRLDSLLPPSDQSRERDQLLRDAYTIARRCGYARGGRTALSRLGQRAAIKGDVDRARKLLMQQLEISEESADSEDDVNSALLLGDLMMREGDSLVAQAFFRRAQRSSQRLDYSYGLAESLSRQVDLLDPQAAPEVIAEMQRMALDAARATGDVELQSRVVLDLASTMERSGRFDEAVILFGQAVEFAREIGDYQAEIESLLSLEGIERRRKRWEQLAKHQRDLLLVEERHGNRTGAASWAIELGVTLVEVGQPGAAAEAFRRGLSNAQAVADPLLSQRALGGVGAAELALKRVPEGIDALMQALAIARAHDDPVHEAKWLAEISQSLSSFGYHEDALRNATDGLAVARRIDDEALQVSLLALTGKLQQQLGQSTRARESYTRALDLAKKADLPADQMRMTANLGNMALATRQWAQAATLFTQALNFAEQVGDRVMASRLHGRLGQIAQEQRDPAAAMDHYRRAVDDAERGDDPLVAQKALANLAAAQHRADDPVAANTYRRALNAAQQLGDKREEAVLRVNLGSYLADQGQAKESLEHLYAAAALARGLGPEGDEIFTRATELAERLDDGGRTGGPRSWGSYAGSVNLAAATTAIRAVVTDVATRPLRRTTRRRTANTVVATNRAVTRRRTTVAAMAGTVTPGRLTPTTPMHRAAGTAGRPMAKCQSRPSPGCSAGTRSPTSRGWPGRRRLRRRAGSGRSRRRIPAITRRSLITPRIWTTRTARTRCTARKPCRPIDGAGVNESETTPGVQSRGRGSAFLH